MALQTIFPPFKQQNCIADMTSILFLFEQLRKHFYSSKPGNNDKELEGALMKLREMVRNELISGVNMNFMANGM